MPRVSWDAIDRRILKVIQEEARISNAELAARVGLSPSPCWRRVRALEDAEVIRSYVTLVMPKPSGCRSTSLPRSPWKSRSSVRWRRFERAVAERPEVMECYLMTGEFDYLLRVVVPSLGAYERFLMDHLTRIEGIASIKSSFALKQVRYKTALPLTHIEG